MKKQKEPFVFALDVGSSGVRVRAFDRRGQSLAGIKVKRLHALTTTADGGAVLDARAVAGACDEVLGAAVTALAGAGTVAGVASDTLVPNIVGLDARGVPITPVFTWGDTRASADARTLRKRLDPAEYHERTGCFLHTSYVPAKLAWLRRTAPGITRRVRRWVSLGEYLFLRWFGEARCSLSVASWSGLLNRHTLDWDRETLEALDLAPEHLGTLGDVGTPLVGLGPKYQKRWPALREIPFLPTVGDGVGSSIGSGCTTSDRIALAMGTSGAMRVMIEGTPGKLPPGLWAYRVDRHRSLLGGAVSNGTNVFDWLRRTLILPEPDALEAALSAQPPAGHGLRVLPLLAGERSPGWADDATAAFVGLRWSTQPIQILHAALEAVAYRFALIHQSLAGQVPAEHTIVASGKGFVQSPTWVHMMADVLGRPVVLSEEKSATARGIALLAFDALGIQPLKAPALSGGRVVRPRPKWRAHHQDALARHRALYDALIGKGA